MNLMADQTVTKTDDYTWNTLDVITTVTMVIMITIISSITLINI